LIQNLRENRFAVDYSLTPAKSDKQFQRAMELGAVTRSNWNAAKMGNYRAFQKFEDARRKTRKSRGSRDALRAKTALSNNRVPRPASI